MIFNSHIAACLLQQLECLTFSRDGREFISSHTDGSYIIWTTNEPNIPREAATTPYGNLVDISGVKTLWLTFLSLSCWWQGGATGVASD